MKFTKHNNPRRKNHHHRTTRTDADIMTARRALDDSRQGNTQPATFYDYTSDRASGRASRHIYD